MAKRTRKQGQKVVPLKQSKEKSNTLRNALFIIIFSIVGIGVGLLGGLYLTGNSHILSTMSIMGNSGEISSTNIALEPFLVNLQSDNSNTFYVRMSLTLNTDDRFSEDIVENKMPLIRDRVITYLSSQDYKSLTTRHEERNEMVFKEELADTLNETLGYDAIIEVLVTDLIIQ